MYGGKEKKMQSQWERWVVSTIVLPKSALRKRWRCYWETRRQRATCADSNRQSKKNIWKKNHLLLLILAVIGRYGSHLMIVMLFVTQNNLKRSRSFRPSPWILPPPALSLSTWPCRPEIELIVGSYSLNQLLAWFLLLPFCLLIVVVWFCTSFFTLRDINMYKRATSWSNI